MRINPAAWDTQALRDLVVWIVAIFLVWFVNMAITGLIARRQGRDDGLWALIAFLIGPLALVTLLVAPRSFLRRSAPDPTLAAPADAPEWQPHEEGWLQLAYPPPPITVGQRLLAAVLGAALGGGAAALLLAAADRPAISLEIVVWSMAGAVAGFLLSGELIGAERARLFRVGVAAAGLVIVVAELIVNVLIELQRESIGAIRIFSIMIAAGASIVSPIIYALFAQGLLAAALAGGLVWAALMSRLLRRDERPVEGSLVAH